LLVLIVIYCIVVPVLFVVYYLLVFTFGTLYIVVTLPHTFGCRLYIYLLLLDYHLHILFVWIGIAPYICCYWITRTFLLDWRPVVLIGYPFTVDCIPQMYCWMDYCIIVHSDSCIVLFVLFVPIIVYIYWPFVGLYCTFVLPLLLWLAIVVIGPFIYCIALQLCLTLCDPWLYWFLCAPCTVCTWLHCCIGLYHCRIIYCIVWFPCWLFIVTLLCYSYYSQFTMPCYLLQLLTITVYCYLCLIVPLCDYSTFGYWIVYLVCHLIWIIAFAVTIHSFGCWFGYYLVDYWLYLFIVFITFVVIVLHCCTLLWLFIYPYCCLVICIGLFTLLFVIIYTFIIAIAITLDCVDWIVHYCGYYSCTLPLPSLWLLLLHCVPSYLLFPYLDIIYWIGLGLLLFVIGRLFLYCYWIVIIVVLWIIGLLALLLPGPVVDYPILDYIIYCWIPLYLVVALWICIRYSLIGLYLYVVVILLLYNGLYIAHLLHRLLLWLYCICCIVAIVALDCCCIVTLLYGCILSGLPCHIGIVI